MAARVRRPFLEDDGAAGADEVDVRIWVVPMNASDDPDGGPALQTSVPSSRERDRLPHRSHWIDNED
jgi:hypothetical protein